MDPTRLASAVRRMFWLIISLTFVAGASAYLISSQLPRQYESEARILVGTLTETNTDRLNAYQQLAQTYAAIATTTPLLSRVADGVGIREEPSRLRQRIDARAAVGQNIVRIFATASTPSAAAQLANAIAEAIVVLATPSGENATSLATVIQPAVASPDPVSPRVLVNALLAACVGFALGLGVALVVTTSEPRARADDDHVPASVAWPEAK